MAIGIAGDNAVARSQQVATLSLIELRVLANLIQQQMGTAMQDDLNVVRADQAFELGTPTNLPVAGTQY